MKKKISKQIRMRKRRKMIRLCGLAAVCIFIIAGFFGFTMKRYVDKFAPDTIGKGLYIGDTDVSGMTKEDAVKAAEKMVTQYKDITITLVVEDKTATAVLAELGFGVNNVKQLAEQALNYGKTGSLFKRYRDIKKLDKVKKVIQPTYVIDREKTAAVLTERCTPLVNPAVNASISRTEETFKVEDGKKGETLDTKASVKKIESFLNTDWHGKTGEVVMVTAVDEPKITKKQLSDIKDLLGTYTTYYGEGGGRVQNVETSANLINGGIIMQGEEYSANAVMEPYTVENGYTEAGSYENGAVVQSMGGGICQVSSTLYNAVLLAELEVTQRSPHSMLVSYVEPSMDAAIAGDYLDLKFRNNTQYPIYIESVLSGGNVTFNIYGKESRKPERTVQYQSEIIEETIPEGTRFEEDPEAALGSMQTISGAYTGIKARLWKIVYESGTEISREEVNSSVYEAVKPLVRVGTMTDRADAKAAVRAAISSQDEAAIHAAIQQTR